MGGTRELRRWNRRLHQYQPYFVPAEWRVSQYEDMDTMVNCASCGTELRFGETYTSREIHGRMGFGYGVCEKCYGEEWAREKAEMDRED